jgi:integrase
MCSYLRRRDGGVYYTRMVVPPRLRPIIGKSDLGRSLRTKDLNDAKRLLPAWLEEAQSIIAAAERQLGNGHSPATANGASYPITQEQADWEAENDRYWLQVELEDDAKAEAAEAFEARLQRPETELNKDEAAAARLLREARRDRDRYRDRYHRRKRRDLRQAPDNSAQSAPAGTMLDTTIVDLWAAERKPKQKGIDTHRGVARWFYDRVGRKPVDQITRNDVLAFKSKLLEDGQTAANIKMKLSRLRTLLQWAADNGHAASNVAHGVTIKDTQAARNKRKPFDLEALNAIFGSPVYAEGQRPTQGRGEAAYWIPLLALFTGARMEELGQLRPDDVVKLSYPDPDGQEQSGWFLKLVEVEGEDGTELKTAESERLIPLHPELQRRGFLAFAQAMKDQGHARLFPLLTPGPYGNLTHKWGQWFGAYLRNTCGVTDKRMTFHSFRHTFTDYVRRPDIPEGIQRQLVGHSSKDVHDDYGSGYNLHWLTEAMKLYKVPGLKLPE